MLAAGSVPALAQVSAEGLGFFHQLFRETFEWSPSLPEIIGYMKTLEFNPNANPPVPLVTFGSRLSGHPISVSVPRTLTAEISRHNMLFFFFPVKLV